MLRSNVFDAVNQSLSRMLHRKWYFVYSSTNGHFVQFSRVSAYERVDCINL